MIKRHSNDTTKIVILLPYGIGNLLLLYPVLKKLHEMKIAFDVVSYLKSVDIIMQQWEPFKNLYRKKFFIPSKPLQAPKIIAAIRKESYDVSILSFPSARPHYNALQFLCGAKKRITARYPDDSLFSLSFLATIKVPVEIALHDTFQNLRLVNAAGFSIRKDEIEFFSRKEKSEKRIGFHVGCKKVDSYRRWPLSCWEKLIEMVQNEAPSHELVLFFGPDENEELHYFENIKGVTIKKGLSLDSLYDEISRCRLFLSNDSGLMHIAAFTGAHSVSLWGPSDFRRTGPFSNDATIVHTDHPCRPCTHSYYRKTHTFNCPDKNIACIREIKPEQVMEKIVNFLDSSMS